MMLEPFDDIVEDRMQMATTLQILLTMIIGLVLKLDSEGEYESFVVGALLVFMNGIVAFISFVFTILGLPKCSINKDAILSIMKKDKLDASEKEVELSTMNSDTAEEEEGEIATTTVNPMNESNNIDDTIVDVANVNKKIPPHLDFSLPPRVSRTRESRRRRHSL